MNELPDTIPGLHHHPVRFKTRRAWGRVTDRQMVLFVFAHFDDQGNSRVPETEMWKRRHKPIIDALIYNCHAKPVYGNYRGGSTMMLIGPMYEMVTSLAFRRQFGLVMLEHQPWLEKSHERTT